MTDLNAPIFHAEPPFAAHWCCTSSICVGSYTPEMSTFCAAHASAREPRMGPEVVTGEHTRIRLSADAIDRDIACTSLRLRPGQKQGRTRAPSPTEHHGAETWPDIATTGLPQRPW